MSPATTDKPTPAVGNELFLHNMRALWRHDPVTALRVDAVPDEGRLPLEETRSGAWTVKAPSADGGSVYLHSRYDPAKEADRFVEAIPLDEKYCFVVAGLGLGYHIRALFERLLGDAMIVCLEPSIPLIATALTCVDLSDVIASDRFIILIDDDKGRIHECLRPRSTLMMLGTRFVSHPPSVRTSQAEHEKINDAISEFVTYTRMSLLTLVSNSRITCKNIANNLVTYAATPPIDLLRDRFRGNPAVVVSAGPSLSRNLDGLKAMRGKAVVCAVQTAIKPLIKHGIVPDFVTSLDYHEMSQKFFEEVEGLEGVHLVAEPKATWHVVDNYPGPVSLLDNAWARLVIGEKLGARDGVKAGATVAHLAFYLAVYMGCDPIIFVGQDLGFTGHVYYVPGVEIHQAWRAELNRFQSIEQKEWERIVRARPILRRVPAAGGGEIYSDELLLTYLEQFEKDIAEAPARVINATEGGARIRGTEDMSLAEAAARFASEPIDPERLRYRRTTDWHDPSRLKDVASQLESRIEELDDVVTVCDEMLALLAELDELTHDPDRFNKRLVRVDELRVRVSQESRPFQIVNAATQLAEFRRFSADRKISAGQKSEAQRAKAQIARDIEFVTSVREGTNEVRPILSEALERIERAVKKA